MQAKWILKRSKVDTATAAKMLGVSQATAAVLINRGLSTTQSVHTFMQGTLGDLGDPYLMKDMQKAVDTVIGAIESDEQIAIFGDYDVDGVMSAVILLKGLSPYTNNIKQYTPDRKQDGYGLNTAALNHLHSEGVTTIIACDNGIAAIEEAQLAKTLGIKLIILDHHEPYNDANKQDILPDAVAVVDPKQAACPYPFKHLCAAGIAYRFYCCLHSAMGQTPKDDEDCLLFAAIATICDIVALSGENRILVKCGLQLFHQSSNIGLNALIERTGLNIRGITPYQIGFVIGPCINAAGRLASANTAVSLFMTNDKKRAGELADQLAALNAERKDLTATATQRLIAVVQNSDIQHDKVFVLFDKELHESIAGIVAGRIKDKFYHPAVVLTAGEPMPKGSARSIPCYNIFEGLSEVKDLFHKFGGHSQAAGLSLPEENIELLRQRINENCLLETDDFVPIITIDMQLNLSAINFGLYNELKALEPFGQGNPAPVFAQKQVQVNQLDFIGKEKDILKFGCASGYGKSIVAISFNGFTQFVQQARAVFDEDVFDKIMKGGPVDFKMDIVFRIEQNDYNGSRTLQLLLIDFRL